MPHRPKNPAVVAFRQESRKISKLGEEPHALGLNELPVRANPPLPTDLPRVVDQKVLSFRKPPEQKILQPKG